MLRPLFFILGLATLCLGQVQANADLFQYGQTVGNDYGPSDWSKVTCSNEETCVSSSLVHCTDKARFELEHSCIK
jgi:hypothetical protein